MADGAQGLGLLPLENGPRVDFARLRTDRRARLRDAMAAAGLDALVLGRPANIRYASGARQLWTAGARPFAPGCVVLADPLEVHLLSVWDEGVPEEIPHRALYGMSWNPANLGRALQRIDGLRRCRTIGTDARTPLAAQLVSAAAPAAELVDASAAIARARAIKTADEVRCIATATAVAESGVDAVLAALRPGASEPELTGVFAARVAVLGAPILTSDAVAVVTTSAQSAPAAGRGRRVAPGDLVALQAGVLVAGYEGTVARTWPAQRVGTDGSVAWRALAERARAALDALVEACRPGARGADLQRAWEDRREATPSAPLVHGLGMGAEAPLVDAIRGGEARCEHGMVLAVQAWVHDAGTGGWLERDTVVVGDPPTRLSTFARPC